MKMKKMLFALTALVLLLGVAVAQGSKGAEISVATPDHDFGNITESAGKVSHTFSFKNTGTAPLVITRVIASCGCTTPQYSNEPIAPGKEGKIVVTFDPAGRPGQFLKTIAVYSNGKDGATTLRVKGVVK